VRRPSKNSCVLARLFFIVRAFYYIRNASEGDETRPQSLNTDCKIYLSILTASIITRYLVGELCASAFLLPGLSSLSPSLSAAGYAALSLFLLTGAFKANLRGALNIHSIDRWKTNCLRLIQARVFIFSFAMCPNYNQIIISFIITPAKFFFI
jgi:hypothetical protein